MGIVGTAEYLFKATGLNRVLAGLRKFSGTVTKAMDRGGKATEKTDKITRKSIVGYSALGAAIGVVFTDFLRGSSVISTTMSTFSTLFGALADTILVQFIPLFEPLIAGFTQLIAWFQQLPAPAQLVIGAIIAISAALMIIGGPLTAVILVITAIILIWQNWGAIVKWFQNNILTPLANFLAPYIAAFMVVWQALASFFTWLWEVAIAPLFRWWVDNILTPFVAVVSGIVDVFRGIWDGLVGFFTALWGFIAPIFAWVINNVIKPFVDFFTNPVGAIMAAWEALVGFFRGVWDAIVSGFRWFVNLIAGGVEAFVNAFIGGINLLIDGLNVIAGLVGFQIPHIPTLRIPRMQEGGEVIRTGVAIVHRGETVVPAGGGAPITIQMTNVFEIGAGAPGLPDLGADDAFRRRFREAGEEIGEGILTTLHRRRE